jgi:asparagine synthase (glutamine-hydrolysing)
VPEPVRLVDGRAYQYWALSIAQRGLVLNHVEQLGASYGLEMRMPLMDVDVVDFSFALEPRELSGGVRKKHLLRGAMVGVLPQEVLERDKTPGFREVVARDWDDLAARLRERNSVLVGKRILNPDLLDRALRVGHIGVAERAQYVSSVYLCEAFSRRFENESGV